MKSLWLAVSLSVAAVSVATLPLDAEAKRLGGGKAAGMQRQAPAPQQSTPLPASPNPAAAPTNSAAARAATPAAAAAAAPAKRSWMGPIAGLAAGLGIAALMSHLGLGEAFGNFLTMALLALVAVIAIRWLMGRFGARKTAPAGMPQGMQLATAGGAPMPDERPAAFRPEPVVQRSTVESAPVAPAMAGGASSAAAWAVPAQTAALPGFDAEGFERIAKMIFIRLQAANDAGDVDDLRKFTTPELFASLRLDLQERGGLAQRTDVVQLNAKVVDTARDGDQNVVSVRFDGLIREESEGAAAPFDEVWHLVQPADGSREWAIAGITPVN